MAAKSELEIIVGLTDQTKGPMSGLLGNLKKVGLIAGGVAVAGVGALAVGVGKFVSDAIPAASDLNEAMNAVNVVFEDNADTIAAWGKTAADTAGLSQAEFAQMAAQTGAMLQNFGLDQAEAADQTINLAQRAADMASIFNTDVNDALVAIQAGIRGEADPLERFGVSLNAAAVKAKALELGLDDADGALSQSALTTARLALLFEQTDKIAGDFVNTSDQLANASRVQAARWQNFLANIGTKFLPIIQRFQGIFMRLAERVLPLVEKAIDKIMPSIERFADLIGQLIQVIIEMGINSSEVKEVLTSMFGPEVAGVITTIISTLTSVYEIIRLLATGDFRGGIFGLTEDSPLIDFLLTVRELFVENREIILRVIGGIAAGLAAFSIISTVVGWITGLITVIGTLSAAFTAAGGGIAGIIAILGGPFTLIIAAIVGLIALFALAWKNNWGGIQEKTQAVIQFVRNLIQTFLDWVTAFWDAHGAQILALVQSIWDGIQAIIDWVLQYVRTIFEAWQAAFSGDWETFGAKIREAWDMVWDLVVTAVENAWTFIQDAVAAGIQAVIDWFLNTDWHQVGLDVVQGIANGISAGVSWVVDAITGVAKAAWDAIQGFFKGGSPSMLMAELGRDIDRGLGIGITAEGNNPIRAATTIGQNVVSAFTDNLSLGGQGFSGLGGLGLPALRPDLALASSGVNIGQPAEKEPVVQITANIYNDADIEDLAKRLADVYRRRIR